MPFLPPGEDSTDGWHISTFESTFLELVCNPGIYTCWAAIVSFSFFIVFGAEKEK
jgi:hypothetical protein